MRELLLCSPDYYGIEYEINPWMSRARGAETPVAQEQWRGLHATLSKLDCKVELVDPRFYHLDTCFCPLPDGAAVWFPAAFDEYGQHAIREHVSDLIDVVPEEAMHFCCNAVVIERDVVLPEGAPKLAAALTGRSYRCHPLPMTEFLKAGGACKCLTLFLPQLEKI